MALRHWSTSASGNANTVGINWAEGQPPSTVNDSARELMAQVRRQYRPDEWTWVAISNTASVASQTSFRVSTDLTSVFHAQRRVRLQSASTTRYATVLSSSFTAETTVTVTVDAGSLSSSHTIAALGPAASSPANPQTFLPLAGGTLSGNLTISAVNASLGLNCTAAGQTGAMYLRTGVNDRWSLGKGNGAESGANVGSDFFVNRFADNGAFLGTPFSIDRASGDATFGNRLTVGLNFNVAGIANLNQSSGYTAVYGNLSVAGGSGGFVPGILAHFRNGGFASALVETTGSGQQARIGIKAPGAEWIMYTSGGAMALHQIGAADRLIIGTDGGVVVNGGNFYPRGGIFDINNVANHSIYWDGTSTIQMHDSGDYKFFTRASNTFGWVINNQTVGFVQSDGIRSRTNAKAWVNAQGGTLFDSHNVSSITYVSAGTYVVNFATNLANTVYATVGIGEQVGSFPPNIVTYNGPGAQSVNSVGIALATGGGTRQDSKWAIAVFGGGL